MKIMSFPNQYAAFSLSVCNKLIYPVRANVKLTPHKSKKAGPLNGDSNLGRLNRHSIWNLWYVATAHTQIEFYPLTTCGDLWCFCCHVSRNKSPWHHIRHEKEWEFKTLFRPSAVSAPNTQMYRQETRELAFAVGPRRPSVGPNLFSRAHVDMVMRAASNQPICTSFTFHAEVKTGRPGRDPAIVTPVCMCFVYLGDIRDYLIDGQMGQWT